MPWGENGNNNGPWGQGPQGPKPPFPENDNLDEFIKKGQDKIKDLFPGGKKPDGNKSVIALLAAIAFALFIISDIIYIVEEGSEGVVLRFGSYNRTEPPGLNYRLPTPIEKVINVPVEAIRKEEIGFRSSLKRENAVLEESLMLTGDENIVDVHLDVQWNIKDAKDYIFNVRDLYGENTVKAAVESAIRYVIGDSDYTEAISATGRENITLNTREIIQKTLDSYKMGVDIKSVQIKQIDPPSQVIDAFRDVQTARADKEREINEAEAYKNDKIPRAKGWAEKVLQEAEAYKSEVISQAEGESSRFLAIYQKYLRAKEVTKRRIYLETMEEILQGTDKILVDNSAGSGVIPYLPLNELNKK